LLYFLKEKKLPTILETLEFVKKAHSQTNGTDKSGKTPYYWHLLRVMIRLNEDNLELCQVALLHDVLEDTPIKEEDLREFGFSEKVIEAVKFCSNNFYKDKTYAQWMTIVQESNNELAIKVKLADIVDNISYERMIGLKQKYLNEKKEKPVDKIKEVLFSDKVFKRINKKMKLLGEANMASRYYKGLDILLQNPLAQNYIKNINATSFGFIDEYKKLIEFIPKEELKEYMKLNELDAWKTHIKVEIFKDSSSQEYLAAYLPEEIIQSYNKTLNTYLKNHNYSEKQIETYFQNQNIRDKNTHHITILNAIEFGKIKKFKGIEHIEKILFPNQNAEIVLTDIGSIKDNKTNNETFYIIARSGFLDKLREDFGLKNKDYHCTLAFDEKDVFSQIKDKKTSVVNFNDVWKNFIVESFSSKQHKLKNK
jgi:hypothetical protein